MKHKMVPLLMEKKTKENGETTYEALAVLKWTPEQLMNFAKQNPVRKIIDVPVEGEISPDLVYGNNEEKGIIRGFTGGVIKFPEIMKFVKDFSCAIDVGAHRGSWTEQMSARFKEVHAFEPVPDNFDHLKRRLMPEDNVLAYSVAIGDRNEWVTLTDDQPDYGNYVKDVGQGPTKMVALDTVDLKPSFLKIDVEGMETKVLNGAKEMINKYKPVICIENKGYAQERYGDDDPALILEEWGYKLMMTDEPDQVWVHDP